MHIYIPLEAKYTYQQSQLFANIIVKFVHKQIPDFTSLERSIAARNGKNVPRLFTEPTGRYHRWPLFPAAKTSLGNCNNLMPLTWEEVKPGLTIQHFNIHNALGRLKETGDLFQGVLGNGIDLEKTLNKAQSVFK